MGYILALAVALAESGKDVLGKIASRVLPVPLLLGAYKLVALTIVLPLAVLTWRAQDISFLPILVADALLNTLAFYLYLKAISISPLSLTVPLLSFSPLFLLLSSYLMLGQRVSFAGAVGVLLVVVGAYFLNVSDIRRGILAPIRSLLSEPGSRHMLIVALIWSITANLDKMGVDRVGPLAWVALMSGGVSLGAFAVASLRGDVRAKASHLHIVAIMGILDALGAVLQMVAITLTLVPYVIAIKRTSILWSAIAGILIFKEKKPHERLLGAAMMLSGVVLILLRA
ncbi:MAG: EamA family transporter [Thermotogae bacterium]|nr:EamA family transporter [Thermotogota bacterium]